MVQCARDASNLDTRANLVLLNEIGKGPRSLADDIWMQGNQLFIKSYDR